MPQDPLTPPEIFETLAKDANPNLSASAQEPFHQIQASLILDQIQDVFIRLSNQLATEQDFSTDPSIPHLPHVLRFSVHLALFLRQLGYTLPELQVNLVIQGFIQLLIKSGKRDLVAPYTHHLPSSMQIQVYSQFLKSIHDDQHVRIEYLKMAFAHGLPGMEIARQTVELIFKDGFYQVSVY